MELQIVLFQRSARTPQETPHAVIMRKMMVCIEELQLRLGLRFRSPVFDLVSLSSALERCRARTRVASAEKEIAWSLKGSDCSFHADAQSLSIIIVEVADSFFSIGAGTIKAFAHAENACFQMQLTAAVEVRRDREVQDELAELVSRYGGTLTWEVNGKELTVAFPHIPGAENGAME